MAEALGTFALVFVGCGAIMVDAETSRLGHLGVSAAFGLVIMAMIYAVGHVSGAHLNPAVTFAFALTRHFPWPWVAGYWAAQVAGAVAAALVLRASLGDVANIGATTPSGSDAQSFLFELVLTGFLLFVIMAVATDTRAVGEAAALAVGGTIAFASLVGGPISGASLNPARSLGPAVVSATYGTLWLYIAAPLLGAVVGALAYHVVRGEDAAAGAADDTGSAGRSVTSTGIAVVTDIHANLPALEAVLSRIEELGIEQIYCGGDLVGYGHHANEVCSLVSERAHPDPLRQYDCDRSQPRGLRLLLVGA